MFRLIISKEILETVLIHTKKNTSPYSYYDDFLYLDPKLGFKYK